MRIVGQWLCLAPSRINSNPASARRNNRCNRDTFTGAFRGKTGTHVKMSPVALGWAQSSINAAVFRGSSVISHGKEQYVAFYDADSNVVLGKRKSGADKWQTQKTRYEAVRAVAM